MNPSPYCGDDLLEEDAGLVDDAIVEGDSECPICGEIFDGLD